MTRPVADSESHLTAEAALNALNEHLALHDGQIRRFSVETSDDFGLSVMRDVTARGESLVSEASIRISGVTRLDVTWDVPDSEFYLV